MDVAETLECPLCGTTCTVDTDQDSIVIDYDYDEWRRRCRHSDADDLATCPEMLARIRRLVAAK